MLRSDGAKVRKMCIQPLQYEKLWGGYDNASRTPMLMSVPRERGQQLKEPAQMDGWLRDGSAEYVQSLCEW